MAWNRGHKLTQPVVTGNNTWQRHMYGKHEGVNTQTNDKTKDTCEQ